MFQGNFTSHLIPNSVRVREMSLSIADSQLRGMAGTSLLVFFFLLQVYCFSHSSVGFKNKTKNCTVLHKDRHLDQWINWEFRNKPIHLWSLDFQQGSQEFNGERIMFSTSGTRQLNILMQESEVGLLTWPYTKMR